MASREYDDSKISVLLNPVWYFIESVLIIRQGGKYRLLAIHNGRILMDAVYDSERGAKIAFAKSFGSKAFKKGLKAEWSSFYNPEKVFLDLKTAARGEQPHIRFGSGY